jgi:hypothetical protein
MRALAKLRTISYRILRFFGQFAQLMLCAGRNQKKYFQGGKGAVAPQFFTTLFQKGGVGLAFPKFGPTRNLITDLASKRCKTAQDGAKRRRRRKTAQNGAKRRKRK